MSGHIVCSVCGAILGDIEGDGDSHTICDNCLPEYEEAFDPDEFWRDYNSDNDEESE